MTEQMTVQSSSGNIFADLGLANSDDLVIKAELVRQIRLLIEATGLTKTDVAKVLGVNQTKVSAMLCGKFAGFPTELNALGSDVEIRVIPKL